MQFIQPRRDHYCKDESYAGAFTCWKDLSWDDDDLDLEAEFKERTATSDAMSLTGLTRTLDIAEPGLKVATMTNRQRKNFNQGVQAVSSNSDVIAICLDQNLSGPEGIVDGPRRDPCYVK